MKYLVLTLALVGCRTQPLTHPIDDTPIVGGDLGIPDLPRLVDLAIPVGRLGCSTLNSCVNACDTNRCTRSCYDQATSAAQDLYQSAVECLYNWCFDAQPNRPARCEPGPNGQPRDPPDMGFGGCRRCLENAFAELGGAPCDPANPDCHPAGCEMEVQSCLRN